MTRDTLMMRLAVGDAMVIQLMLGDPLAMMHTGLCGLHESKRDRQRGQ